MLFRCLLGLSVLAPTAAAQDAQQFPAGSLPRALAFDPARNQLLVSSAGDNSVVVFDYLNPSVRPRVVTSVNAPGGLAVDEELGVAVVTNPASNQVTIVDLATLAVRTPRIDVESGPFSVEINTNTHVAVVSNANSRTLSLIDLRTLRLVGTIADVPVSSEAVQAVAVNSSTNTAVAVNTALNSVNVIDLGTRRVIEPAIPVGPRPMAVAVNPQTNVAVVCNASGNSASIVDLGTRNVREVALGAGPQGVAIHLPSNTAVISLTFSNELVLLDLATLRETGRLRSVPNPLSAATGNFGGAPLGAAALPPSNSIALFAVRGAAAFNAVVNAASFQNYIAAGGIASVFGATLANGTEAATTLPLPTTLQGARVRVGGRDSPLFFVSPSQINFQAPVDASGRQTIEVLRDNLVALTGEILVDVAAPALFTQAPVVVTTLTADVSTTGVLTATPASMNGIVPGVFLQVGAGAGAELVRVLSVTATGFTAAFARRHVRDERIVGAQIGAGPLAALNSDGTVVSIDACITGAKSAAPGSIVQLFGNGQGALTPALSTGQVAPSSPLSTTRNRPQVLLGGVPVTVDFSGAAPGFVGLWQINIRIPNNPPSGPAVPLVVIHEGRSTPNTGTLAVNTEVRACPNPGSGGGGGGGGEKPPEGPPKP